MALLDVADTRCFSFTDVLLFRSCNPDWFKASFPAVSLAHENNYAVWWAGICLLLTALIFYRLGSLKQLSTKDSLPWYLLAVVILALSIDELGSLHEMVREFFGWLGLLPFAMVFGIAFTYALITLSINKKTRLSAILVLIAIGLFVMVAGLEFVEHNVHFDSYAIQRLRLIGEEGIELISASLLIISGLAIRRVYFLCISFLSRQSPVFTVQQNLEHRVSSDYPGSFCYSHLCPKHIISIAL